MKTVNISMPIVGWATASVKLPGEWEDATDEEITRGLVEGELNLDDFKVMMTTPISRLRDAEDEVEGSEIPYSIEVER